MRCIGDLPLATGWAGAKGSPRWSGSGWVSILGGRVSAGAVMSISARDRLGQVYRQQLEWFFEDLDISVRKLGQTDPLRVWIDHMSRRVDHLGKGAEGLIDAARTFGAGVRRTAKEARGRSGAAPRSIAERLRTDHYHLHRILIILDHLAECSPRLTGSQRDVLVAAVDYLAEYPDCVHHPLEDRVFARLLDAQLSAQERQRVNTNAAKHIELTAATMQLQRDLRSLSGGESEARQTLGRDLNEYIEAQRRHMTFEEQFIFPRRYGRRIGDRSRPMKQKPRTRCSTVDKRVTTSCTSTLRVKPRDPARRVADPLLASQ